MGVKNVISHILIITWKDLMELFRNKMALAMLVLMPIFMMTMAGFIFPSNTSMSSVSIALVNEDEGYGNYSASSIFINVLEEINNSTEMMVLTNASSFDEVRNMIQRDDVEGGIVITRNFTSNLMTGEQGSIIIVTDQSNPQLSIALQTGLKEVFDQMGTWLAQQNVETLSPLVNATNSLAVVKPYHVETKGAIPGTFNYFDFMAPGLMAMTVMMSVMTGLPAAISHEREIGTLDGMMVAPIRRLGIILGKTLAQTVRGLLQGTLILILAIALFSVVIHGNILLIFALLFLGVFSFVGLGVVITSFAKDQETAMMVMMTLMFPMLFLSGVFFPIQQMPWYMQNISKVLPLTYAITALRKVMVLGADLSAISLEVAVLIGFGTVMILIALPVFRKAMTR
ncbi:MAG: ABC transporter permease [Candidatus Korarchaeota archaeon]|jgi:ABC-2 type transport system permease protein|nr:ABC transporter permease [Candidatus Korarchaeota archaeon]